MATDFTQDSVLHFLQSSGASVKNSDLLQHFRTFIRDHADRDRNRELFKKFVNSVATVQQIDGVSHVVLRKKFRGHVPGEQGRSGPRLPDPDRVRPSPAQCAEPARQRAQLEEVTTPARKTVLPAAGIMLNNNNSVERNLNLNQQRGPCRPEGTGRPAAQGESQISERAELKTPSLAKPPVVDQRLIPPHGITPVAPAVSLHRETSQQVPHTLTGGGTHRLSEGGVHQEPDLHHIAVRHIRHRKSYKAAVSLDEDEEEDEEEEEVPVRRGSAGGAWPLNAPLKDTGRAISASSPCIVDQPAPPPVNSPFSSERKLPQIYVQHIEAEPLPPGGAGWSSEWPQWAGPGMEPGSAPEERTSPRRSLPLDAGRYVVSPDQTEEVAANRSVHTHHSQPADVQWGARQGPDQSPSDRLLSSHSSILSPSSDTGLSSSDHSSSDDHRRLGLNSSFEELQARRGKPCSKIQDVLQRTQRTQLESRAPWHHSTGHLYDDQEPIAHLSPFHHSSDYLHDNQDSTASVLPWRLSTGDDREEAESSDGSTSSPPLRQRPAVARRLSSQLRSRMCRSMGADLDQLLQEEARGGGGSEVARLNRLQLISSSLSLRYDLSSSSLSSCSTPPRCHSVADLAEGAEGRRGSKSLPSASTSPHHPEGSSRQSLVPLEPREHAWLVKGAAGAWPDIYSLFREDSSLLNKKDFISGFTVLHWIAKHGDHRVLNTLWYGVQKAGLTFNINSRSTCGQTPLHIAAMHGNKHILQLLVNKFKADMRLRDTAGKKAWQYLSCNMPPDIFQLLGAPSRVAWGGQGVERVDTSWKQEKGQRRRHYLSSASSGERPLTLSGAMKVKRSSSIATLLKHKSMRRFYGHQSDSSV